MLKGNALDAGNDDNTGGNGGVDANYVVQNETPLPSATANLNVSITAATFTWANEIGCLLGMPPTLHTANTAHPQQSRMQQEGEAPAKTTRDHGAPNVGTSVSANLRIAITTKGRAIKAEGIHGSPKMFALCHQAVKRKLNHDRAFPEERTSTGKQTNHIQLFFQCKFWFINNDLIP